MKNRLVLVGMMGDRRAYLNVSRDEALRRWKAAYPHDYIDNPESDIKEFEFDDEFWVYTADALSADDLAYERPTPAFVGWVQDPGDVAPRWIGPEHLKP